MVFSLRRLHDDDLHAVLKIQEAAYPELAESSVAIADRLQQAPQWCWGAEQHGQLCAYLLAHPWPATAPPPWDTPLPRLPRHSTHLYIHDLALGPQARSGGLARRLINTVLQQARHARIAEVNLVAVQSSTGFWQRQGFHIMQTPATLGSTLASYGDDARLMWRRV